MKKHAGFTLTEMLIVIVIIAILATIALPSYREAVRRSDRRAAQAAMMEIASRERQYFVANRTFTEDTTLFALPAELQGKYTFAITTAAGPPPSFLITFNPAGAQVPDGVLTLNSAGVKTPADKW